MANWWEGLTIDNPSIGNQQAVQSLQYAQPGRTISQPVNLPAVMNSGGLTVNKTGGSVQGTSTSVGNTQYGPFLPTNTNNGGGGGGGGDSKFDQYSKMASEGSLNPAQRSEYEAMMSSMRNSESNVRGEIEGGYNNYFNQLNSMMGELPNQADAQKGIVETQYNQGVGDLASQKTQGLADLSAQGRKLDEGQNKNLKSLADNLQNQFLAGNVFLGSRGAGDSSASNQYSYALNKLGSKQRGDIMGQTATQKNDIADREFKLNTIFDQETNKLKSERDTKTYEIANWLSEAQNAVKGMVAEGQLNKGRDLANLSSQILNYAMQQASALQQQYLNKKSTLESWAINQSSNINQLKQNLGAVSAFSAVVPSYQPVTGSPSVDAAGNINTPAGFGYSTEDQKKQGIFQ